MKENGSRSHAHARLQGQCPSCHGRRPWLRRRGHATVVGIEADCSHRADRDASRMHSSSIDAHWTREVRSVPGVRRVKRVTKALRTCVASKAVALARSA